jgi:hypothetical protein
MNRGDAEPAVRDRDRGGEDTGALERADARVRERPVAVVDASARVELLGEGLGKAHEGRAGLVRAVRSNMGLTR